MKKITALAAIAVLSLVLTAHAQPPDSIASDINNNTAGGTAALVNNQDIPDRGSMLGLVAARNTAFGSHALMHNSTGASGIEASYNTGIGHIALWLNTTGSRNTALGAETLWSNISGDDNTAAGTFASSGNITGSRNTSVGEVALDWDTDGDDNTALGFAALYRTQGSNNTAIGTWSLLNAVDGYNNLALGFEAGFYLTTGSNNVDIANLGKAGDNGVMRIGTPGVQTATYLAGASAAQSVPAGARVLVIGTDGKVSSVPLSACR